MSNVMQTLQKIKPSHLLIRGLPITATSGDLRRAVMLAGVVGVTDVSLVYKRFLPTGQGILTLSGPDLLREALSAAKKITFTGREEIIASITLDPRLTSKDRQRGVKGRADALNRALIGFGPSAGFPVGRTVTVVGFPGKTSLRNFMPFVKGFQLALDETKSVVQAPIPSRTVFSMFSRFVVMLASESEAQRLVRKLHRTQSPYPPYTSQREDRYLMATVIY